MITEAIKSLNSNEICILVDDSELQHKPYLMTAADKVQDKTLAKIADLGKGILLLPIRESRAEEIGISSLTTNPLHPYPLTIGIEAREHVGSGISISDRNTTIKAILHSNSQSKKIVAPGHLFPLIAKDQGLLVKVGIAEAACDLLKYSNLEELAVISHAMNDRGDFLNSSEIEDLSREYNLPIVKLSSIIQTRLVNENLVTLHSSANLPTEKFGSYKAHCLISKHDNAEHLVLVKGDININEPVLTRMHSEKKLGDTFFFEDIPEKEKIERSLNLISNEGRGVLVYIKKAGNSISQSLIESKESKGLPNNTSHKLIELREIGIGAQILKELGITKIKLLTKSKKVFNNLEPYGIKITEQVLI